MNAYNVKQLEKAVDILDDLEEQILPAYAEAEVRYDDLSQMEINSNACIKAEEIYGSLDAALYQIRCAKESLKFTLERIKGD